MLGTACEAVRRWIGASERSGSLAPPFALGAHVLVCSTCRGALAALLAALAPRQHPAPIACTACQSRLDAFMDCERQHGSGAALRRDPAVWWHLWTCGACAEIYHLTTALIDAEAQGALPPLASALPAARRTPRIAIELPVPRQFLRQVVAPHAALGRPWLDGDDPLLVDEELVQEYRIALFIRPRGGERWGLSVTIVPPLTGQLRIRLGGDLFQARFNDQGEAHLDDVPIALLQAARGPDMQIAITSDDDTP